MIYYIYDIEYDILYILVFDGVISQAALVTFGFVEQAESPNLRNTFSLFRKLRKFCATTSFNLNKREVRRCASPSK